MQWYMTSAEEREGVSRTVRGLGGAGWGNHGQVAWDSGKAFGPWHWTMCVHNSSLKEMSSILGVGIKRSHRMTVKESDLNSPSVTHLLQIVNCAYMLLTMEMGTKAVYPS